MYYIYLKRKDGSKFPIGANVLLKSIDEYTTKFKENKDILQDVKNVDSIPLDIEEGIFIKKDDEDGIVEYGEVLLSDYRDVVGDDNIKIENKKKIREKCWNHDFMILFLNKYVELTSGKGVSDSVMGTIKKILTISNEQCEDYFTFCYAYFLILLEEMFGEYEVYRFAYLANKSLELEQKKVKCITKNIKGRRKIQ